MCRMDIRKCTQKQSSKTGFTFGNGYTINIDYIGFDSTIQV